MLRIFEFTIDLRQRLLTRHGEHGVAKGDKEAEEAEPHTGVMDEAVACLICSGGCAGRLLRREAA